MEAILFPLRHLCLLVFLFTIWQFQPLLVKKDQEEKSDKRVTNGISSNQKPDPVGAVESSSSAASPQASA